MSSYPGIPPGWIVFDMEKPHPEPLSFIAGDSLYWKRSFEEWPSSGGWTLTYVLNNPTQKYTVASGDIMPDTEDNVDGFTVKIPATETKGWAPGWYLWLAVLINATTGERKTCAMGRVLVEADILDSTTPVDTRAQEEIALENIKLMLAGRASDGVQEYKIADRELRRYTLTELLQLKAHFASEVRKLRIRRGEYQEPDTVAFHAGWGING